MLKGFNEDTFFFLSQIEGHRQMYILNICTHEKRMYAATLHLRLGMNCWNKKKGGKEMRTITETSFYVADYRCVGTMFLSYIIHSES